MTGSPGDRLRAWWVRFKTGAVAGTGAPSCGVADDDALTRARSDLHATTSEVLRRSLRRGEPLPDPDPSFPFFSVVEGAYLRRVAHEAFAEVGVECLMASDHLVDDHGRRFGLWHLAATCHAVPLEQWPPLVRLHAARTADSPPWGSAAQVHRAVRRRLVPAAALEEPHRLGHCLEVAPGLVEVMALDFPDRVVIPPWSGLRWHGTPGDLIAAAQANLLSEVDAVERTAVSTPASEPISHLHGSSFFVASLSLLEHDTPGLHPLGDHRLGRLVVVPNRHDFVSVRAASLRSRAVIDDLAGIGARLYAGGPGPVSPYVYWVCRGRWWQLTGGDGARLELPPPLASVVDLP